MDALDPFNAVMGRKRGALAPDTILSLRPTDAAHADLESYLQQLRERNFAKTLSVLSERHALIPDRPLLGKLAAEFCRYLVGQSALHFDDALRHYLHVTRVYPRESDFLLLGSDLSRRNAGQRRGLHVWVDGDKVGPLGCLSEAAETVCGLEVNKAAWRRVDRGTWQAENLTELKWERCQQCEQKCPAKLRYALEETPRYIPFGAPLYTKLLRAVTPKAVEQLGAGGFATVADATAIANRSYHRMLLPASVAYVTRSGEPAIQWLLDTRVWHQQRREHGSVLHKLLNADDWRGALGPCIPQSTDDGRVLQASPEQLASARAVLSQLIQARASAPGLATEH